MKQARDLHRTSLPKLDNYFQRIEYNNCVALASPEFRSKVPDTETLLSVLSTGEQVESGGRGGARFVSISDCDWIVRDYRRGGLQGKINRDRYLFWNEETVRALHEARLLNYLFALGLPVPRVVAALYQRFAMTYRCTIILERLNGVQPFGDVAFNLPECRWFRVGQLIRRLHNCRVNHVDLNCFNILVSESEDYLIDFDKCYLVHNNLVNCFCDWKKCNLNRLRRSLYKLVKGKDVSCFESLWRQLQAGYQMGEGNCSGTIG